MGSPALVQSQEWSMIAVLLFLNEQQPLHGSWSKSNLAPDDISWHPQYNMCAVRHTDSSFSCWDHGIPSCFFTIWGLQANSSGVFSKERGWLSTFNLWDSWIPWGPHGNGLILSWNWVHHKQKGTMWFVVILASYLSRWREPCDWAPSWFVMPSVLRQPHDMVPSWLVTSWRWWRLWDSIDMLVNATTTWQKPTW